MEQLIEFLITNKEWLFSGLGITIIYLVYHFFKPKKNDRIVIQNNYQSSQSEIRIIAESIFKDNFPKMQEIAKEEADKNKDLFLDELTRRLQYCFFTSEYNNFKDPDIQYSLLEAMKTSSRKDSKTNREILSDLLINRVKNHGYEFNEIIFNEAIKSVSLLTSNQIRVLSLVEITSSLIYRIINEDIVIDNISSLNEYINDEFIISEYDLLHLRNYSLIISTFPYEIDRTQIYKYKQESYKPLIERCVELIELYSSYDLNQIKLTPTGQALSQTFISRIIDTPINYITNPPLKLADFRADNIYAEGDVTAYSKKD